MQRSQLQPGRQSATKTDDALTSFGATIDTGEVLAAPFFTVVDGAGDEIIALAVGRAPLDRSIATVVDDVGITGVGLIDFPTGNQQSKAEKETDHATAEVKRTKRHE